ncbi:ethylbenzene dehydrogenase-related protein [Devosia sp.]|uniref:ethylbenzene dehydrogenase-related protein n=1 Tax=Devosia sp. TaxID=1871048 RepID=UPI003BACD408
MGFARLRRTDIGTVVWHWLLVVSLAVAMSTGLRIAADDPGLRWLLALDAVLPRENLWLWHVIGALGFTAALCGYAAYILLARLTQRSRLDRTRLTTLARAGSGRWAALGVVVLWIAFGAFAVEIASGLMLYLGQAGWALVLHRNAVWICLAFPLLHVLIHALYGGVAQLLRIVLPTRLVETPPEPDILGLLADHIQLVDEMRRGVASDPAPLTAPASPQGKPRAPLVASLLVGLLTLAAGVAFDRSSAVALVVRPIGELGVMERPEIDGDISDAIWVSAPPVSIVTTEGANLAGTGESRVEVRAVHDFDNLYMAITWDDPTRSLKHRPLVKREDGWHVVETDPNPAREDVFNEDKFSILITQPTLPVIGAAIHLAAKPLADAPASASGRGLHYTAPNGLADVWVWRASHGGAGGHIEDAHFIGPMRPSPAQIAGNERYTGGFGLDDGDPCHADNMQPANGSVVTPLRLPKDMAHAIEELGEVYDNGDFSEEEDTNWWLSDTESQPYSTTADASIPLGAIIPGVLVSCTPSGDVADVHGVARWSAGRWTLELAAPLATASHGDIPIASGDMLWVAVFDHSATHHTHHTRPLTLELK